MSASFVVGVAFTDAELGEVVAARPWPVGVPLPEPGERLHLVSLLPGASRWLIVRRRWCVHPGYDGGGPSVGVRWELACDVTGHP